MKVLGIIAEYNPFHKGHAYHIEESRRMIDPDYVIAVMSGNFTQRGDAAIMDKWERSRQAVQGGVDMVLELPFVYACSVAEKFATGAVDILIKAGVTHISFGSEAGDAQELDRAVELIIENENRLLEARSNYMKEGNSFARSQQRAIEAVIGSDVAELINTPNNILAVEYIKRIKYWKDKGKEVDYTTMPRYGSGYFEANEDTGYAGASAIRDMILKIQKNDDSKAGEIISKISGFVSSNVLEDLMQADNIESREERMLDMLKLEFIRQRREDIAGMYCVGEGIEGKLKKEIMAGSLYREVIKASASRRYTEAAVRRITVYILMGIYDADIGRCMYGRVLAANKRGRKYLRYMADRGDGQLPFIMNVNKIGKGVLKELELDIRAMDLYNIICRRDMYRNSDRVKMAYLD